MAFPGLQGTYRTPCLMRRGLSAEAAEPEATPALLRTTSLRGRLPKGRDQSVRLWSAQKHPGLTRSEDAKPHLAEAQRFPRYSRDVSDERPILNGDALPVLKAALTTYKRAVRRHEGVVSGLRAS
jgi:hypothetical protein